MLDNSSFTHDNLIVEWCAEAHFCFMCTVPEVQVIKTLSGCHWRPIAPVAQLLEKLYVYIMAQGCYL